MGGQFGFVQPIGSNPYRLCQIGYRFCKTASMQAAGEAIPAAPVANESTEKPCIRAVMSPEKLEMVCNTLLIPANMKQFGFMLGETKSGRS